MFESRREGMTATQKFFEVLGRSLIVALASIFFTPFLCLIYGWFICMAWNYVMPAFGAIHLTYWQSVALCYLSAIFLPKQIITMPIKGENNERRTR
jgi:hypothetical protein